MQKGDSAPAGPQENAQHPAALQDALDLFDFPGAALTAAAVKLTPGS